MGNIIYPSDISFTTFSPTRDFGEPEKGEVKDSSTGFNLEKNETSLIKDALKATSYNYSAAARKLGITAPALYRRIKKYNIKDVHEVSERHKK